MNHGKKKKKVIFFGDTVNDLDNKPGGYISWIVNHLKNEGLEDRYNLVSAVRAGEKIYDLYMRLEESVLVKDATLVVLYAGVNDVWDKYLKGTGTDAETFESLFHAIINKLEAANIKVVVCTPVATLKTSFPQDILLELADYAAIIRSAAVERNLPMADLEQALHRKQTSNSGNLLNTNQLVADEIWEVLRALR